jgi:hypothetical protein
LAIPAYYESLKPEFKKQKHINLIEEQVDEMTEVLHDEAKLKEIYEKVIAIPNKNSAHKGFIICPDCGEEILLIPTLRVMNEAIENHIQKHKELLKDNPIKLHQTAILVRLSFMTQVLQSRTSNLMS